mgnify:FL=1
MRPKNFRATYIKCDENFYDKFHVAIKIKILYMKPINYITFCLLIISLSSCKKYLDKAPLDSINSAYVGQSA